MKFHNGDELTADDVVSSIAYAQSYPASMTYTGSIASVEAVDPYTVKITTSSPTPNLLYDLAYHYNMILPKSLIDSGNDFSANPRWAPAPTSSPHGTRATPSPSRP